MVFQSNVANNQISNPSTFIDTYRLNWIFILTTVKMVYAELFYDRSILYPYERKNDTTCRSYEPLELEVGMILMHVYPKAIFRQSNLWSPLGNTL